MCRSMFITTKVILLLLVGVGGGEQVIMSKRKRKGEPKNVNRWVVQSTRGGGAPGDCNWDETRDKGSTGDEVGDY